MLKILGICPTGGIAKVLIQAGEVRVNGSVEMRRGRKLRPGDVVDVTGAGAYRIIEEVTQ